MDTETTYTRGATFDDVVVPHLVAARRLARWLMRNDHDADDVVQDASLRALRYFRTFTGGSGRAWFLRIVRNTCYSRRGRAVPVALDIFDEEQHATGDQVPNPETLLLRTDGVALVARAMNGLPARSRELLVRRELEGLSYQELADVMKVPIGTVMSSLSRARRALRSALDAQLTSSDSGVESRLGREVDVARRTIQEEISDAIVHGRTRSH
jgi:RNA polymerase sigma-70 factor (ECF subfamily)